MSNIEKFNPTIKEDAFLPLIMHSRYKYRLLVEDKEKTPFKELVSLKKTNFSEQDSNLQNNQKKPKKTKEYSIYS